MLQNRTYLGEIVHKGQFHPGEHTPIIDQPLWDAVQEQLAGNTARRQCGRRTRQSSLLAGMLFDGDGNRMTPSHAGKKSTHYRYYVSGSLSADRTETFFQAHCPPYFATMDAAVDAALAPLLRWKQIAPEPASTGPVPHPISDAEDQEGTVDISEEGIACTKSICNYIHETYGRFPGSLDAMHMMWFMQAYHLDLDFYDKFFRPGSYGPTHAAHMTTWHPRAPGSAKHVMKCQQ